MTKSICVLYWFIFLTHVCPFFFNFLLYDIVDFVNKTSCVKDGACANEKRKRCNRIPSDITLDRNYATVGYTNMIKYVN